MLYCPKGTASPDDLVKQQKRERLDKHHKFVDEIQTILEMTNCIPFKVQATKLFCAYCYLTIDSFENTDDFRLHNIEKHSDVKKRTVESLLRPLWANEVLRIDIYNLTCKVCDEKIKGWNEMFQHMYDKHEQQFDEAYTRLIPYKLTHDIRCALCNERQTNIHQVDAHMNSHYNNHVCQECGETFVSLQRIKKHVLAHERGSYVCKYCGKSFSMKKSRDKHTMTLHENVKTHKCSYCSERFATDYEKHCHTVTYHKEKVKIFTCEFCGKTYNWRLHYKNHLITAHKRRHRCPYCMKWFANTYDFKLHVQRHTGSGNFICHSCGKNFVTKQELQSHQRVHDKEKKNEKE